MHLSVLRAPTVRRSPARIAHRAADESPRTARRSLRWCDNSCLYQWTVHIRPPVAEELPRLPHFADHVQIQIRGQYFIFVARSLRHESPTRIAEVTLSVKLADVPRRLHAHAIDRTDEISIRHRVRRLLQLPQVFAQP